MPFLDGETLVRLLRQVAYQGTPPDPGVPPPRFEGWPILAWPTGGASSFA
jgi:hypothetical protein